VVVSDYPKTSGGSPATGTRNTQYGVLRTGDLLFFHTTSSDDVTHVGMLMGLTDGTGKRRLVSSRFYLNGPSINTSSDTSSQGGDSIIDGDPTKDSLTRTYRAARRL
jgi:cell wall-associated NlpC family hydrolase